MFPKQSLRCLRHLETLEKRVRKSDSGWNRKGGDWGLKCPWSVLESDRKSGYCWGGHSSQNRRKQKCWRFYTEYEHSHQAKIDVRENNGSFALVSKEDSSDPETAKNRELEAERKSRQKGGLVVEAEDLLYHGKLQFSRRIQDALRSLSDHLLLQNCCMWEQVVLYSVLANGAAFNIYKDTFNL